MHLFINFFYCLIFAFSVYDTAFANEAIPYEQFVAVDTTNGSFDSSVKQDLDRKNIGYKLLVSPITRNQLDGASVLVLSGAFRDKPRTYGTNSALSKHYSNDEIATIKSYVREGGVLIAAGQAWYWAYPKYGNKKIEDYPLNQIGEALDFSIGAGWCQFVKYEDHFQKIVRLAQTPQGATFSDVKIRGEYDKLIRSSSENGYCGLGAKRSGGYIYIFGHEVVLQCNPSFVSSVFLGLSPRVRKKDAPVNQLIDSNRSPVIKDKPAIVFDAVAGKQIEDMDFKFYYDLGELQKPYTQLLNEYLEQLHLDKVQYQQAGNLKAALAHEQEIVEVRPKDLGEKPEWRAPEDPIIIKKRQEFMTKHAALVSRNYDAAIALGRGYADQLNALIVARTKAGKLQEALSFRSRLDDLRTTMTIYRQMDKSVVEMRSWVKETLELMPERPQSAGGALPKLALVGTKAGEVKRMQLAQDVSMEFCWCPPGEFVMGSSFSEKSRGGNENQVNVKISKGFWMGRYEVTQEQWKAVMGSNPSSISGDHLPVQRVSWNEVQDFLQKLNQKLGTDSRSKVVLPTEAQWEYGCRAGEKGSYSGGSIDDVAWYDNNSNSQPHPVGTKKSNAWGLHDMHGNVAEWCSDWYASQPQGGVDPIGALSGSGRLYRGGCWFNDMCYCRAAGRFSGAPTDLNIALGFRVARISAP